MDAGARLELLLRDPVMEAVTRDELKTLLEGGRKPKHYIGFEISGMLHLGSGLLTKLVLDRLREAGVETTIFLADLHSWVNGKMGGDLDRIRAVARDYYIPAFKSLGLEETKFVLASDTYDKDYWTLVLKVAQKTTLARGLRTLTILGRLESDLQSVAQLVYAPMQVADIFTLGVQIAHAGIDQRKAHMLAREVAPDLGFEKPVCLHHALLPNILSSRIKGFYLPEAGTISSQSEIDVEQISPERVRIKDRKEPDKSAIVKSISQDDLLVKNKMSKSQPEGCIFIHDSEEAIRRKVNKAFCEPKKIEGNKPLELCRWIVFPAQSFLEVHRESKYGGDIRFNSFGSLAVAYAEGKLHPQDLKAAVAVALIGLLERPRKYFESHPGLLEPFRGET